MTGRERKNFYLYLHKEEDFEIRQLFVTDRVEANEGLFGFFISFTLDGLSRVKNSGFLQDPPDLADEFDLIATINPIEGHRIIFDVSYLAKCIATLPVPWLENQPLPEVCLQFSNIYNLRHLMETVGFWGGNGSCLYTNPQVLYSGRNCSSC